MELRRLQCISQSRQLKSMIAIVAIITLEINTLIPRPISSPISCMKPLLVSRYMTRISECSTQLKTVKMAIQWATATVIKTTSIILFLPKTNPHNSLLFLQSNRTLRVQFRDQQKKKNAIITKEIIIMIILLGRLQVEIII